MTFIRLVDMPMRLECSISPHLSLEEKMFKCKMDTFQLIQGLFRFLDFRV